LWQVKADKVHCLAVKDKIVLLASGDQN
jgi:hypothetical protein